MLGEGLCSPLPSPPLPFPSCSPPRCPELDLSLPLSPAPRTNPTHPVGHLKPLPHSQNQHVTQTLPRIPAADRRTQGKLNRQVHFKEPLVAVVTTEPSNRLCNTHSEAGSTRRPRKEAHCHGRADGQQPCFLADVSNENQGCVKEGGASLEGVRLNTSLALRVELQSLQGAEFNCQRAVEETLQRSTRTKNQINAKVTEGVNVSQSQLLYPSLVSVSVEEDQLISQAVHDRLLLGPASCQHNTKTEQAPSLLHFLTPDLQREKALLLHDSLLLSPEQPLGPSHSTFDLYRQQACWEEGP